MINHEPDMKSLVLSYTLLFKLLDYNELKPWHTIEIRPQSNWMADSQFLPALSGLDLTSDLANHWNRFQLCNQGDRPLSPLMERRSIYYSNGGSSAIIIMLTLSHLAGGVWEPRIVMSWHNLLVWLLWCANVQDMRQPLSGRPHRCNECSTPLGPVTSLPARNTDPDAPWSTYSGHSSKWLDLSQEGYPQEIPSSPPKYLMYYLVRRNIQQSISIRTQILWTNMTYKNQISSI